jgi:pyruvate formate lyase activating enzyme
MDEDYMIKCKECQINPAANFIGICAECLRKASNSESLVNIHESVRERFDLPKLPPHAEAGIRCSLCANNCRMGNGDIGFCGLHYNRAGKRAHRYSTHTALSYMYLDLLPTNCCATWFCQGSKEPGYNLAVFFYGCNFNCLFCQNASHKNLSGATVVTEDEMVAAAIDSRVRCVCFFGGSPEPQLPFALRVARRIIKESNNNKHICWEWNGCGNPKLVKKAAEMAADSGGTVKFDLKAYHPNICRALCGVDNQQAFRNFQMLAEEFPRTGILTATTLLVPFYIDQQEVESIVKFIANLNSDIPYSLLIFSPHFYLHDLPVTPKWQVNKCYSVACQYLERVHLGNKHLLYFS